VVVRYRLFLVLTSFCVVSALLRISSTHFSAPLLRDVTAEVIEQVKERGNLRAGCPLSIVDFGAHCEDPGIVFLPANTQRGLQDKREEGSDSHKAGSVRV
jgi:hypothetical protein